MTYRKGTRLRMTAQALREQLDGITANALALCNFRDMTPEHDLTCEVHCPNDEPPQISFRCCPNAVFALYGQFGWDSQRRENAVDYCKTLYGVRLVIRNVETVPEPQLEGPIRRLVPTAQP